MFTEIKESMRELWGSVRNPVVTVLGIVAVLVIATTLCVAQVNKITIPNPEDPSTVITVELPGGLTLPIGFNYVGAMIPVLMLLTWLVKAFPPVKSWLEKLLPKQKNSVVICIVFIAGQIAGWATIGFCYISGTPPPIAPNEMFVSALELSAITAGSYSVLIGGIYKGFLKTTIFPKLTGKN